MKTYKWGIIGLGHIAESFAKALAYLPHAELHAVASRSSDKAKLFAEKFNVPVHYGRYDDIVEDPDLDIMYIATPHNRHFGDTMLCLQKKKAVLCEKPLGINLGQVNQMIEAAEENNVFFMEALWTAFLPKIPIVKQIIQSGEIGAIKYLRADFGFCPAFNPDGRLFNPKLAGGSLLDVGIYTIYYALEFLGYPDEIIAHAVLGKTGVDEQCAITLRYNDGRMAQLFSTITAETPLTVDICGTKSHVTIQKPLYAPSNLFVSNKSGNISSVNVKYEGNGYNYEAMEVMKCLKKGKIQSDVVTWDFSRQLIKVMDEVRRQIGLTYPGMD